MDASKPGRIKTNRETRFLKLRALKCFQEVVERIHAGWPIPELARFIQDDRQEYKDIGRDSLVWTLTEFRKTIPPAQLISRRMPQAFNEASKKVEKGIDELEELEGLYKLQMDRIKIDYEAEKTIHKLLPTMTQEVRVAREILQTYADLKMDMGLSKRHLGTLDVDASLVADVAGRYGREDVAQVLNNPGSRHRVLAIAEKLLTFSGKEGEEATIDIVGAGPDPTVGPEPDDHFEDDLSVPDDPIQDDLPADEAPAVPAESEGDVE
jgi:hypothetical protein